MTVAVRVRAMVTGRLRPGWSPRELELALASGDIHADDLVSAAVAAEVAAHEQRADQAVLVRILTARSLAQDLERGAVRTGERERQQEVEVEAAVRAAVLAFHDGLFKVFVGEEELEPGGRTRLDEGTEVLFLRLVPLAGG